MRDSVYICIAITKNTRNMGTIKYLLSQKMDLNWGIVATTVGRQKGGPGERYPYGDHHQSYLFSPTVGRTFYDEYQVVYIIRGSGWFESANIKRRKVKAGDCMMLFPGEWHNYAPDETTGWEEAWIGFRGATIERRVREKFFSKECPVVHVGVDDYMWSLFMHAYQVADRQGPGFQQELAGCVAMIISILYSRSLEENQQDNTTLEKINYAKKIMHESLNKTLSMEAVASEVGMGYSMFRQAFKNQTGYPPAQYYLELKIARSKELLLHTNLACKEIAYKLGFDSVTYFHRIFRKHVGMTPADYRSLVTSPINNAD